MHAGGAHAAILHVQFDAQRFCETAHRELGRVVGALCRHRRQTEHAGNVDHMSPARRLQVRQKRARTVGHAPEIDVHEPLEIFVAHAFHRRAQGHPGIVEDQIHLAVLAHHLVGPFINHRAIGHVQTSRGATHAAVLQQSRRLRQSRLVHIAERQIASLIGQGPRQRPTDSRARTSDRGHLVAERFHGLLILVFGLSRIPYGAECYIG